MNKSLKVFKVGTRSSNLALAQAKNAVKKINKLLINQQFVLQKYSSPGDKDRTTDLSLSPANFFTQELDEAVLSGQIDCAIHSAKDVPYPIADGLDWFWLPWHEDARDALLLPQEKKIEQLPAKPRIGISSKRREKYCSKHFPHCEKLTIRGNIEERIAQLDDGKYDMIIMAVAALNRLNLQHRISKILNIAEMPVPAGQGILCVTFRKNDSNMLKIRQCFTYPAQFAGASVGSADLATIKTIDSLKNCDICYYDSLMDQKLINYLPNTAQAIYVGKRSGKHSIEQKNITCLIADSIRQGKRLVRLKGGDPSIFGRLAEELEYLQQLSLPFEITPGISTLNAVATQSGILLTRRGISRGFTVMTPRQAGGAIAKVDATTRAKLPLLFYMAVKSASQVCQQLINEGRPANESVAVIFAVGSSSEFTVRGTLTNIPTKIAEQNSTLPGILIVGEVTKYKFTDHSLLQKKRILVTCSQALQNKTQKIIRRYGGIPIAMPLIQMIVNKNCNAHLQQIQNYDWLIFTSPSAIRIFMQQAKEQKIDMRKIPKILVCGKGSVEQLAKYNLYADATPEFDFGAEQLLKTASNIIKPNSKILRLRSDKAGTKLSKSLQKMNFQVDDCVLYHNQGKHHSELPQYDTIIFASASAVEQYIIQFGKESLQNKTISVIGQPTILALNKYKCKVSVIAHEATMEGCVTSLATYFINNNSE